MNSGMSEVDLKIQIAKLLATVDSLTAKVAEKDAIIAQIEHRYTRLTRLEIADLIT